MLLNPSCVPATALGFRVEQRTEEQGPALPELMWDEGRQIINRQINTRVR